MASFSFIQLHKDKRTLARMGVIHTPHGDIETPAFVPVGTQATVKSLTPEDVSTTGTQLYFVNTYHMYLRPGIDVVKKSGGLHGFMHWDKPLITDSGGFQIFSLAQKTVNRKENDPCYHVLKHSNMRPLVSITNDGVEFRSHWDGSPHFFTPESSMKWQWELGADIHIAFDDCTPYPVTHTQASVSLGRTHRWAVQSLKEHLRLSLRSREQRGRSNLSKNKIATPATTSESRNDKKAPYQALYGSIQGSIYEDLRKESAKFISVMDFDGYAIGGVAVGESKREMKSVLDWTVPFLPPGKPRHLLGVGEIDDIFTLVEAGLDTFDCVQPTRIARAGFLLIRNKKSKFQMNITQSRYATDLNPVSGDCSCYTCRNFTRAYIRHLFHVRELLAYRLATIHNLHFVHTLVSDIRESIRNNSFLELKKQWL